MQALLAKKVTMARCIFKLYCRCTISVSDLIPHATLQRRPLQFALKRVWDGEVRSLDKEVQVTSELRDIVLWWSKP